MIDPSARPDPPLGMPDPPKDWFEFWVRFTCGALFGLIIGGLLWLRDLLGIRARLAGHSSRRPRLRTRRGAMRRRLLGIPSISWLVSVVVVVSSLNIYGECRLARNPVREFR